MKKLQNKKGQAMVEYVLMISITVMIFLAFYNIVSPYIARYLGHFGIMVHKLVINGYVNLDTPLLCKIQLF